MLKKEKSEKEVTQKRVRAFTLNYQAARKSHAIALKPDASGIVRKNSLMTYGNLMKETSTFVDKLKMVTDDLSLKTIKNIVSYTRQLVKPGQDQLDENIFHAQMSKYFKITDSYLLSRIYEVIRCKKVQNCFVLNYAKLVCIFISEDMIPKIDYAFRVYDVRGAGFLNIKDLETALRPLIQYTHIASADASSSQSSMDLSTDDINKKMLKEIVTLLLNMIDSNNDMTIDLEEFHDIVLRHPLMLECLGPCLPGKAERDDFLKLVEDKSPFEVAAYFRHERKLSLNDPTNDKSIYDKLYPFQLEFP